MYVMISEYGNEIAYAEDEATRERLIGLGFKEQKKRTVRKGAEKDERENSDRA